MAVQLAGLFFLQESKLMLIPYQYSHCLTGYAPLLLENKAARIRKSLDLEKNQKEVRTIFDSEDRQYASS